MMSLEDNEKLRQGEADVRVLTCKAKGRGQGQPDEGRPTRLKRRLSKGAIYAKFLNVCSNANVVSMKSGATSAVDRHITE